MQGEWNHDAAYYRCRYPNEYALANKVVHPRNVYLREDALTPTLERWLARAFAPGRRSTLVDQMYASQDTGEDPRNEEARRAIADADRKLARHRAVLEALGDDSDPTIVAGWITQTQNERSAAEARLTRGDARTVLSRDEIAGLIKNFTDYVALVRDADPGQKAAFYGHMGLKLTYYPATNSVIAEAQPVASEIGSCPRGDLNPHAR